MLDTLEAPSDQLAEAGTTTKTLVTLVEVTYPPHRGSIGIRGSGSPLSWEETTAPSEVQGSQHIFRLEVPVGEIIELKLVRNDDEWANGRNYILHAGDHVQLEPYFDASSVRLEPRKSVEHNGFTIDYEVLLPASYDEQEDKRYPVLYAVDGQSLWSSSEDPFGVWGLDLVLDRLYELAAIEEMIVVGVHTSIDRTDRLSPAADSEHGGGAGLAFLDAMIQGLLPAVNSTWRTKPERESTALLGSSMGGLFSFAGAWTRPEVFGKAACLSSSFWWAQRHAVRMVQTGKCPDPKPMLYLDSGAAVSAFEQDANLRDGFHHTRSMFRALTEHGYASGVDLHRLVFTGHSHDAASWSARIAIPLQLLFPPGARTPHTAPVNGEPALSALQPASARVCNGQLREGRLAHSGENSARSEPARARQSASGAVGRAIGEGRVSVAAPSPSSREAYEDGVWVPSHNPWAIALTVALATFMEVLDTSIADVSLPHIAGDLSASQDEATWVLTSYLVANAVILPLSGWFSGRIGPTRLSMISVAVFTISSFLCGFAPSLPWGSKSPSHFFVLAHAYRLELQRKESPGTVAPDVLFYLHRRIPCPRPSVPQPMSLLPGQVR